MSENLGIYIHIPFCRSKCPYCDFFSFRADEEAIKDYIITLCKKIESYGKKNDKTVDTIYIGGGTPTVLGADLCCEIVDCVKSSFNTVRDPEITIEANPSSGKTFDFKKAFEHGINRVSLGVQSVNANELKQLGRIHTKEDVLNTISNIKTSGIKNFSLDIMLGIPEQTIETLNKSLEFCVNSGASHISSYILKIEENTIFYKRREKYNFPDDDFTAELYLYAVNYLSRNGFNQYEISNFAKQGFESKHNLKYWMLDDYLGIGPAAHSMIDGKRFYYDRSIKNFADDIIIPDGDAEDIFEYIMLRLRLSKGINVDNTEKAFGIKFPESFLKYLKTCCNNNLMEYKDGFYSFTPRGFLVSNSIIAELSNRIV